MSQSVHYKVRLATRIWQDGDVWLASCPQLDVVTQDATRDGDSAAIAEAVEGWFESCIERGVLEEALREVGFVPANGAQTRDSADSDQGAFIEISIPAFVAA